MDTFFLQPWITLKGTSTGDTVIQSEPKWLDLAGYREAVVWLDIREFTSSTNIAIALQSSPAKEEALFVPMATFGGGAHPLVTGVTTQLCAPETMPSARKPLSRWLRWSVAFTAASQDITFRIWIAANKPGRASTNRGAAMSR